MRLAYLSGSLLPSPFANSVHVVKMCRAFAATGLTVTLHAREGAHGDADPLASYGIEQSFELALSSPPRGRLLQSAAFALAVRAQLGRRRPDLLYARHLWSLVAAAPLGVPFVYEAHALPPNAVHRAAESFLLRHSGFRRLVVISGALRDDYLALFPWLDAARVLVAHDGADVTGSALARGVTGRAHALQVGYIGHLYPGKGMEIVAALPPLLPEMDFHVVGGTLSDLARWQAQASFDNLHYHGFVPHASLATYYASLDVVLIPVQRRVALQGGKGEIGRWTSPLKLFEAMSFGKAMIVSDHPTLLEVVKDGATALVAPAQDVHAWARSLRRLETAPLLRDRLGDAARQLLESEYTWQQRARHVLSGIAA